MKKKISSRLFFTVIWRGIAQVFCFIGRFLGYKGGNSYTKALWRISATCLTALLFLFTICIIYTFTVNVVIPKYVQPSLNPEWSDEYISNHIVFQTDNWSGKTRVYNKVTGATLLEDVDWVTVSGDNDSLAVFSKDGKRGYLNRFTGKTAIPNIYSRAWIFSEGVAAVEINGKLQFIDKQGKVTIDKDFEIHHSMPDVVFHNGYCLLKSPENGKIGIIDRKGNWALKPECTDITRVDSFWIVEKNNGSTAVLGEGLKVVLPYIKGFYYIENNGIFAAMPDHTLRRYDFSGSIIDSLYIRSVAQIKYSTGELKYIPTEYYNDGDSITISTAFEPINIKATTKCLCYQADWGWYGLMSSDGHIITPPSFSEIKAVNADLFLCKDENGYSVLLDGKGNRVK